MRWECFNSEVSLGPGKRWGHTCNYVKDGKLLYVFGGFSADQVHSNDVHVFDTVKRTWSKPLVKGTPPTPRDSHSCTTIGSRLFVFGGTDGNKPLDDLCVLDTLSNTWIVPAVNGEGPRAREGHGAALVGKRLFIFGGCGISLENQCEEYMNDVYILDTEIFVWKCAKTTGIIPSPRDNHTCSTWRNKIIVIGGEDTSDCYLSDVYMLDSDTLLWERIDTSGHWLAPRAGHTTVSISNQLFVFGGFTDSKNLYDDLSVLNLESRTWSKVATLNCGPSARFAVAGDCIDEHEGIIVFVGGCNEELQPLDDVYYLQTNMQEGNGTSEPHVEQSSYTRMMNKSSGNNLHGFSNDLQLQVCQTGANSVDAESGEVPFEGTITNLIPQGYTIDCFVNGSLLRGVLFSTTATSTLDNHSNSNSHTRRRRVRKNNQGTSTSQQQNPNASLMGNPTCSMASSMAGVGLCQPNLVGESSGNFEGLNMTPNN